MIELAEPEKPYTLVALSRIPGLPARVFVEGRMLSGYLALGPELVELFGDRNEIIFEAILNHGVLTLHRHVGSR